MGGPTASVPANVLALNEWRNEAIGAQLSEVGPHTLLRHRRRTMSATSAPVGVPSAQKSSRPVPLSRTYTPSRASTWKWTSSRSALSVRPSLPSAIRDEHELPQRVARSGALHVHALNARGSVDCGLDGYDDESAQRFAELLLLPFQCVHLEGTRFNIEDQGGLDLDPTACRKIRCTQGRLPGLCGRELRASALAR